jgi:hypothetical protein
MSQIPDFTKYTYEELIDVETSIDKGAYPDRYSRVVELIAKHPKSIEQQSKEKLNTQHVEEKKKPKRVRSKKEIIIAIIFGVGFSAYCLVQEKIPGKHGGFNPTDDYYLYWGFIGFFISTVFYNLYKLKTQF